MNDLLLRAGQHFCFMVMLAGWLWVGYALMDWWLTGEPPKHGVQIWVLH